MIGADIKDIEFALRLRFYNEGKTCWVTKDGTVLKLNEMKTDHLINIYNMMKRKEFVRNHDNLEYCKDMIKRSYEESVMGGDIGDEDDAMG